MSKGLRIGVGEERGKFRKKTKLKGLNKMLQAL
jgi:hypothetical protein